jgi:hypothetical protein
MMRTGRSGHAALALMVVKETAAATRTATANLPFATAFMESPFLSSIALGLTPCCSLQESDLPEPVA